MMKLFYLLIFLVSGCQGVNPDLVKALALDAASSCFTSDIRGGVGTATALSGGYGQSTLAICRSNTPNSSIELKPDGTMTIKNGVTNAQ